MSQPDRGTECSAPHHNAWEQSSDVPLLALTETCHQSMKMGAPGPDWEQRISESCPDPFLRVLFWSIACVEACGAETQPSAFVMHNFEAKVGRGDCSRLLGKDTPQGARISRAKCWLYVLSWLHRKNKEEYHRGAERQLILHCSVASFAGRAVKRAGGVGAVQAAPSPSHARLPERQCWNSEGAVVI